MKDKKAFILYLDQREIFEKLPDEKAGKLIKTIFSYVCDENPEIKDPLIDMAFTAIKQALKRDLKKWSNQLEQRKNAGKKSAESRRTNSTKTNENVRKSTKSTVNVKVKDSVKVKVKVKGKVKKETQLVFSSPLNKTINDFREFRKSIKKPLTEHAEKILRKNLEKFAGDNEQEKIEILEQSIMNGWQGVFELKKDKLSKNMQAMVMIKAKDNEKGGMAII